MLKNKAPGKILEAVNEYYVGGSLITPEIPRKTLTLFTNGKTKPAQHNYENLTEKQFEILELIKSGYSYKRIAEQKIYYCTNSKVPCNENL